LSRLLELVQEGSAAGLYPGGAFAVLRGTGEVIAEGCTGLAQVETQTLVTLDTVWDLASLTKPLATATSVLLLASEGRLTLDEPIAALLPEPAPALEGIALRHCLTHTSGLKPWERLHSRNWSRETIVAQVRSAARQNPIGKAYAYSDLGYILLGEAVAQIAGRPLDEFAQHRVFTPLGMTSTRFLPPDEWQERLAETRCPDRARTLLGVVHDGNCAAMGGVAGHAGLFGSLPDLKRYARMVLAEGRLDDTRVLPPLAVRAMGRNQNPVGISGHTLGWFTRPNGYLPAGDFLPDDTFGHTGFTGTSLLVCPSLNAAVILLTNRVAVERDASDFLRFRRRFHNAAAALL
jgi:CubicO group peptidase (beta-lactamase class C family)